MAITGHKSLQSLSIYQRVKQDEKLMMGMSLPYSLLHPNYIQNVQLECQPHFEGQLKEAQLIPAILPPMENNNNQLVPLQNVQDNYIQNPQVKEIPQQAIALMPTPQFENINAENAIVPYQPNFDTEEPIPPLAQDGFSYLQMLQDNDGDEDIILAATQYEKSIQ